MSTNFLSGDSPFIPVPEEEKPLYRFDFKKLYADESARQKDLAELNTHVHFISATCSLPLREARIGLNHSRSPTRRNHKVTILWTGVGDSWSGRRTKLGCGLVGLRRGVG
jgi:hypothetical protein